MSRQKAAGPKLTAVVTPALLEWELRALAALRLCSFGARELQIDITERIAEAEASKEANKPVRPALRLITGGQS